LDQITLSLPAGDPKDFDEMKTLRCNERREWPADHDKNLQKTSRNPKTYPAIHSVSIFNGLAQSMIAMTMAKAPPKITIGIPKSLTKRPGALDFPSLPIAGGLLR